MLHLVDVNIEFLTQFIRFERCHSFWLETIKHSLLSSCNLKEDAFVGTSMCSLLFPSSEKMMVNRINRQWKIDSANKRII